VTLLSVGLRLIRIGCRPGNFWRRLAIRERQTERIDGTLVIGRVRAHRLVGVARQGRQFARRIGRADQVAQQVAPLAADRPQVLAKMRRPLPGGAARVALQRGAIEELARLGVDDLAASGKGVTERL
jgi:hypothetical protein